MAATLGRRIALAVVVPAAVALAAVDVFAIRAAREAERSQVRRRMENAAAVLVEERRFFLDAPLDAAAIRERLARIAGFDFVLAREGRAPVSSLKAAATAPVLRVPGGARDAEVEAGGRRYLALREDFEGASLILLFATADIDRAGRDAALPVLLASVAGLLLAGLAGAALGARLADPIASLAEDARRVGAAEGPAHVDAGRGPPEVRELARALNAMADRLRSAEEVRVRRERLAVLGEFATGIAHEVRNPLSSIRMTLQLLRDGDPTEREAAEDLDLLLDEVRRLERSVDELLLYAGEPRLDRTNVDVAGLVDDAVRLLGRQADHLGVAIEVESTAAALHADGDADRLRTCVVNLLLNAVQVTPRGGRVTVVIAREPEALSIAVADAGPGIAPEVGEKVFEPFFSGRPGGTGLGLAVTRRIARAHGGEVVVRSGAGGSVFRLSIPAGPTTPAG